MRHVWRVVLFSFNDPAPTEIYTLSLHDALPIYRDRRRHVEMVSRDHHEIELGRNRGEPVELLQPVVDVRDEQTLHGGKYYHRTRAATSGLVPDHGGAIRFRINPAKSSSSAGFKSE